MGSSRVRSSRLAGWRRATLVGLALGFCAGHAGAVKPGDLIVADSALGAIFVVDPTTGRQSLLSAGGDLSTPVSTAVEADGTILSVDSSTNVIVRIDSLSGLQTMLSQQQTRRVRGTAELLKTPVGIAISETERIYVVAIGDRKVRRVLEIDRATGAQTVIASGFPLVHPTALAVAQDDSLYVSDAGARAIFRIDPLTGEIAAISSGGRLSAPNGIAVSSSGQLIVADGGLQGVLSIDPNTGEQTVLSQGENFITPIDVVISADGHPLVLDQVRRAIIRVDIETGAQSLITSDGRLSAPAGLALVPQPPWKPVAAIPLRFFWTHAGSLPDGFEVRVSNHGEHSFELYDVIPTPDQVMYHSPPPEDAYAFELDPIKLEALLGQPVVTIDVGLIAFKDGHLDSDMDIREYNVWGADLNRSGRFDFFDLSLFSTCFRIQNNLPEECDTADLDRDGILGFRDYVVFSQLVRAAR